MNKTILLSFIQEYKNSFEEIHNKEIYKWKAVKVFQENWNLDADNFYDMIDKSLSLSNNLLVSVNYFPRQMLLQNAQKAPTQVRDLFSILFDEEIGLAERYIFFNDEFYKLSKQQFPDAVKIYQDHRAVAVYFSLRYPERYYLYKYTMFKSFADKIEYNYTPIMGHFENLGQYYTMCNLVRNEINKDQELLKLHKSRITKDCYYDRNSHILTQDFIYAVTQYLTIQPSAKESTNSIFNHENSESFDFTNAARTPKLEPKLINHIENNADNKKLGDLGEQFAIQFEKKRLVDAGKVHLANKIKHISAELGDGAGFDIESFNEDGTARYIEVKTTRGDFSQPIYITANELEKSRLDKDNYYLYRIYNYDESKGIGNIKTIRGELTHLCNCPILYKIALNKDLNSLAS